jgi:hypothetical protein
MPSFKDKRQVVDLSQQIESNISRQGVTGHNVRYVLWFFKPGAPVFIVAVKKPDGTLEGRA